MKNTLIVILGPTASGKTALSVKLAKALDGEIISSDSMQIYKHMDIGTAKVTAEEACGIPHYLTDIISPDEEFSVAQFQEAAYKQIEDIFERGKIPLLVGGTGLYINSVIYGYDFVEEEVDHRLRTNLKEGISLHGNEIYHKILFEKIPEVLEKIHVNDTKRIIRAWEVYLQTGKGIATKKRDNTPPDFDYILIGLKTDRENLYERINKRVDVMMESGLLNEVKDLIDKYHLSKVSRQAIGYKEVIDYLRGLSTYEEMLTVLKRETRNYAKRQLTWFRRLEGVKWYNIDSKDDIPIICDKIVRHLQDYSIEARINR
jgi:tRNA dimethylallyltransferase